MDSLRVPENSVRRELNIVTATPRLVTNEKIRFYFSGVFESRLK